MFDCKHDCGFHSSDLIMVETHETSCTGFYTAPDGEQNTDDNEYEMHVLSFADVSSLCLRIHLLGLVGAVISSQAGNS
jgi:hypothetical protein